MSGHMNRFLAFRDLVEGITKCILRPGKKTTYAYTTLGLAAFTVMIASAVNATTQPGWNYSNGFGLLPILSAVAMLAFALLASAWRENPHKPKNSPSSIGGLAALGLGAWGIEAIPAHGFWIGIAALVLTAALSPSGWNSDAQLDEQAAQISRQEATIAELQRQLRK